LPRAILTEFVFVSLTGGLRQYGCHRAQSILALNAFGEPTAQYDGDASPLV
jgi:hypothetical protein